MKILFLGEIGPGQTSRMRMRAFKRLGHEVDGVNTIEPWKRASWLRRQVQRRLQAGSIPDSINQAVLNKARAVSPGHDMGGKAGISEARNHRASYGGSARASFTLRRTRISRWHWKRTRVMDQASDAFDILVYCKAYEQKEYAALGKPLIYMPLGYCDKVHRPLPSSDPRWKSAVGFLGGWEPRREHLLHVLAAVGIDLKIRGGYWEFLRDGKWTPRRQFILKQLAGSDRFRIHRDKFLARAWQGGEVYEDDYARALDRREDWSRAAAQGLPGSAYHAHVRDSCMRQHAACGPDRRTSRAVRRRQGGRIFCLDRGARRQGKVLLRR